ncbi:hypothetical protein MMD27_000267 [Acinetobacter baumannii]|nr:hypothetical protein [Acinetobacter baumannii]
MKLPCTLRNHPNRFQIILVLILSTLLATLSVYYAFDNLAAQSEAKAFTKDIKR